MSARTPLARWLLCALLAAFACLPARAAPPQTISYQGYLTSNTGVPTNATLSIQFALYTAASGGSALWTETQSVAVTNGNYSVILGNVTPITLPFDVPYFLGVTIGADAEITPRAALTAVPYAFRAQAADGLSGTATIQGSQITGTISGASLSGSTLTQLDGRYVQPTNIAAPQANTFTAVDTAGTVGTHTSITVGTDGLPVISYHDETNANLKVVKCGNSACSAGNTVTTVDATAGTGQYNSIAIGADGLPVISYYDATRLFLKVAKCGNAACSSGNTIAIVTKGGGQFSSIAIGVDGLPVISYVGSGGLTLAKCDSAACNGTNSNNVVQAGSPIQYTSIAIGTDGLPVISYFMVSLRVAKCGNSGCSAGNVNNDVDFGDAFTGQYTSITIGADGLPVLSYQVDLGGSVYALKVAKCVNAACSGVSTKTVVDGSGAGSFPSITIGADAMPVISYYDPASADLKVAKCGNAACSADNAITRVDTTGDVGQHTSITIGADGLPVISYYDVTNADLKVAKCANAFCAPYFRRR